LPRERRPFAAVENTKALVEATREFGRLEHRNARGGEFDGERDAVETTTDFDHGRYVRAVEPETGIRTARAFFEKRDRAVRTCPFDAREFQCRGHVERGYAIDAFAAYGDRLATRRENGDGRAIGKQRRDATCDFTDNVFAIVEDE
jgi:hypothetical protein